MSQHLNTKIALVTGGASGGDRPLARAFANDGGPAIISASSSPFAAGPLS